MVWWWLLDGTRRRRGVAEIEPGVGERPQLARVGRRVADEELAAAVPDDEATVEADPASIRGDRCP
jgi:hypothetical protein